MRAWMSGASQPKSDGPIRKPATISAMTCGCPSACRHQADGPAREEDQCDLCEEDTDRKVCHREGSLTRQYTRPFMDALALLPHRPPMRLLDEVAELVPGQRARGIREVRDGDFFFDGHFPGEPIVPAVILVEMIAQVGGLAAGAPEDPTTASALLRLRVAALGPFRFRGAVRPGARLTIEARVLGRFGGLFKVEGDVHADGRAGRRRQRHARNRWTRRHEAMPGHPSGAGTAGQMRRLVRDLRTEASGPAREAVAVGVGVFIGALPVYGLHLFLCLAAGSLLRLNRLKLYVAANISNPLVAPLLILSEIQAGALARRGELQSLTLAAVRQMDPGTFGGDLFLGSVIVGGLLGLTLGGATYLLTRNPDDDPFFADLVRRASDRFVAASIVAWEFARGKLTGDPLYRTVVMDGVLPAGSGGALVDVGCGSGLTLALLAEAATADREGRWPSYGAGSAALDRLVGIELRPRLAHLARPHSRTPRRSSPATPARSPRRSPTRCCCWTCCT